jgi:acyl-CoA thioesterase I
MNKKTIIILGAAVAIIIGFWLTRPDDENIKKPTADGEAIIVFGDSLVKGDGASPGNDFVSQMAKELDREIINAGVSGDTTVSAMTRYNAEVRDRNPKVVVLLLGGNDFLQGMPVEQTINNLRTMIEVVQAKGAGVVLVGLSEAMAASDYRILAEQTGAVYVPSILDETRKDKSLMSDDVHPNDRGYEVFADKIAPAVEKLL